MKLSRSSVSVLMSLSLVFVAGCADTKYQREAARLIEQGKPQEAVLVLKSGYDARPDDPKLRAEYLNRRDAFVDDALRSGLALRAAGQFEDARIQFTRVLEVDPTNPRAKEGLNNLPRDTRHAEQLKAAGRANASGDPSRALDILRSVLVENPDNSGAIALKREVEDATARLSTTETLLKLPNSQPVSLEFRDAPVRTVFEVLARSTGINFVLDKDVRPDLKTTVYLRDAPVEEAVNLILQTSQLERKVLNANTVLVYPSTPEKLKVYQDLVLKAFYLQNADAKQVQNSLKTLVKTKDLVIDEKLNLIIMRDTPEAIRVAEKLVAMHDLKEPEVMLEIEVLEVQRSKLTNLGIQWPNQLTLTPLNLAGGTSLTVNELRGLNSQRIAITNPSATINLRREVGDVNILANPRIRVRNRESAKVLIGDRLPVVTTNATATGLISENIQYLDVGLKLDAQPDIRLRDEVAIKLSLEVSSIVQQIRTPTGSLAYQIGTRTASTVLRLRDGETQILAGLINDQERSTGNRVPLIGDLPGLNRIFGSQQDERNKTEIILSVTPRVVRNLDYPSASQTEFWSGTEANLRTQPPAIPQAEAGATVSPSLSSNGSSAPAALARSPEATGSASPVILGVPGAIKKPAAGAAAKNVSFAWETAAASADVQQIRLRIKADGALVSVPLHLGFDPSALQVVDVSEGSYFKRNGASSTFSHNVDAAAGKVFVTAGGSDGSGIASGDETLLTLSVRQLNGKGSDVKLLLVAPVAPGAPAPTTALPAPLALPPRP